MAEAEEPKVEVTEEAEQAELERQYLAGEFTETSEPKKEEKKEETESEDTEEEESEVVSEEEPKSEGPAIQENKRLRQKNREVSEQMDELQRQLTSLSEKVTQSEEPKVEPTKIQQASTDDLIDAEIQLDSKIYEAKIAENEEVARQLISAKKSIRLELSKRPAIELNKQHEAEVVQTQWKALEAQVTEAIPDITDSSSDIYKNATNWASENKELVKSYGPHLGGLIATAQALIMSKSKSTKGKTANKSVTKEMEKIAEASTSKSGSTSAAKNQTDIQFSTLSDEDFEAMYTKMQRGEVPVPTHTG